MNFRLKKCAQDNKNSKFNDLIHTIDISATILDYAGVTNFSTVGNGNSFKNVIKWYKIKEIDNKIQ